MNIIRSIKAAVRAWSYRNIPMLIEISECNVRRIINLYEIGVNEPNVDWSMKIEDSVKRLLSQMPIGMTNGNICNCRRMEFFVYEEDRQALKRMCNNYAMWIVDNYEEMPYWVQPLADKQYEEFTEIMVKL